MDFQEDNCVICQKGFETTKPVTVYIKGIQGLMKFSKLRNYPDLENYLNARMNTTPTGKVLVHTECRRDFTNLRRVADDDSSEVQSDAPSCKKLRSNIPSFNWKENCVLCGDSAIVDPRHPVRVKIHKIETLQIHETFMDVCKSRSDEWADEVYLRLNDCTDLISKQAIYHDSCNKSFRMGSPPEQEQRGRQENQEKLQSFHRLCDWLEIDGEAELYTLDELHNKMMDLSEESEIYSIKNFKRKLQEYYGDHIFFAEVKGRSNVVCFKNMANFIINEQWHIDKKADVENETRRIILAASKIIKEDIRNMESDTESYPSNDDIKNVEMGEKCIPPNLLQFLNLLIANKVKRNTIGHCIVQAARPRSVITPTLFGLGVELDHVFGSRWLTDELQRLGLSIGYDEITRFKQSAIQTENSGDIISQFLPGSFTQWVADNVDHNSATLDGKGTFHGMGIIAVSTSSNNMLQPRSNCVRRLNRLKASEAVYNKGVPIVQFVGPSKSTLASLLYKPTIELQILYTLPGDLNTDILWQATTLVSSDNNPRPNWSGFMQHIYKGSGPTKSHITILPIIDLNPSDETCIYSTLLYIEHQSLKLNIITPCITFDQPLWLKAISIIKSKSMNIVCRLGGFHLMMSFLGSIGTMMSGSGIEEALEMIYGQNTITHILSGKAVARALRGHFLIEAALVQKLLNSLSMKNDNEDAGQLFHIGDDDIQGIQSLYDGVMDGSTELSYIQESPLLIKLEKLLNEYKHKLSVESRTAKLWINYLKYVETLKHHIRAERTGDWNLHYVTGCEMINLFAATGHINYAKSCRLYLQLMFDLPTNHPWLYNCFINQGYHTIRRSDRLWAGLSTDLVIEQTLMRTLKSRGGLTRGRGMTETVRNMWTSGMHICASVHDAMTSLTGLQHCSSDQHVEMGSTRCKRDHNDLNKIIGWFDQHEPFDENEPKLRSLSSGITASDGDGVNCDQTEEVLI